MVEAYAAGVLPHEFRRLTVGEIFVCIEGASLRRKHQLLDRIVAVIRGLAQSMSGVDAFEGLVDQSNRSVPISLKEARWRRLWRSER